MSEAARISSDSPQRRSHAERTAETRARIIDAVVDSISDVGFQNTTAAEIVRRAGVTWGAVQHHFGGKDGILKAVLEASFGHFVDHLGDIPAERTPLDKRIDLFIDRAWQHFGSPEYRSTFEILLNWEEQPESRSDSPWQAEMFAAWHGIWVRIFSDIQLPKRRIALLEHYTISVLVGLAATQMLGGPGLRNHTGPLKLLKRTLHMELTGDLGG